MTPLMMWGQKATATAEKVTDNVYRIIVNGSVNITAVMGADAVTLYDAGYKGAEEKVDSVLRSITTLPVTRLFSTHHHPDHTGGNAYFKNKGVELYALPYVLERMEDDGKGSEWITTADEKEWQNTHTGSDVTVYLPQEKVLVAGDLLFEERFPYIDVDSGGDVTVYLETQGEIISSMPSDVKIIGGHGKVYTLTEYEELNSLLWETYDKVKELVMADESLDAIKKADPLSDYGHLEWKLVNKDKWVEIIYHSLR